MTALRGRKGRWLVAAILALVLTVGAGDAARALTIPEDPRGPSPRASLEGCGSPGLTADHTSSPAMPGQVPTPWIAVSSSDDLRYYPGDPGMGTLGTVPGGQC